MSRYAVEANKQMLPDVWYGRRSLSHGGFIIFWFDVAFPLLAFGWVDVGSAMVTQRCGETMRLLVTKKKKEYHGIASGAYLLAK